MKHIAFFLLLLLVATPLWTQCSSCFFYSGDFDPNNPEANGLANESDAIVSGNPYGAATYQNFLVGEPGPTARSPYVGASTDITGLFTNNPSGLNPSSGYWEIRNGVSEGNGGTLIASGTGAVTQTPTGRNGFGFTEYRDEVDGLDVSVNPGVYWFAVVPNDPNNGNRSFNSNTFGLNSVGTDIPNQQYWNSAFFGVNFTNASNEGVFQAFSGGVESDYIPEPSSLFLLGSGLVGIAARASRHIVRR